MELLGNEKQDSFILESFPYHPHPEDNENKNRAPTYEEIKYGVKFLHALNAIFKPEIIAGIGKSGLDLC